MLFKKNRQKLASNNFSEPLYFRPNPTEHVLDMLTLDLLARLSNGSGGSDAAQGVPPEVPGCPLEQHLCLPEDAAAGGSASQPSVQP